MAHQSRRGGHRVTAFHEAVINVKRRDAKQQADVFRDDGKHVDQGLRVAAGNRSCLRGATNHEIVMKGEYDGDRKEWERAATRPPERHAVKIEENEEGEQCERHG